MNELQLKIMKNAVNKFGKSAQEDMVIEEFSELIKAILKYRRNECNQNLQNIVEEIADCEIMLNQIKTLFYGDLTKDVENIVSQKLMRLQLRVLGENFNQ